MTRVTFNNVNDALAPFGVGIEKGRGECAGELNFFDTVEGQFVEYKLASIYGAKITDRTIDGWVEYVRSEIERYDLDNWRE